MLTQFSSQKSFVLTMAGIIIGLGNIWRFPYLVSNYGGGIFVALYLLMLFGVGYFLLLGELSYGKTIRKDFWDGAENIAKREMAPYPKVWQGLISTIPLLCAFLMNIIYVIVIGWILFYCVQNFLYFTDVSSISITHETFYSLTQNFEMQLFWSFVCIVLAYFFLRNASVKALERLSAIFIPSLIFILTYLILWSLSQTGAIDGALSVVRPDWIAVGISPDGFDGLRFLNVILVVIEQVIYSLSLGMGVAYIYGSYASFNINLISATKYIVALDCICSLLSAVFVLAVSTAFDIPKTAGSALTFISLPVAFGQMIGGSFLMFLFYGIFFLAAFTTLISLYEPLVRLLSQKLPLSRGIAFFIVGGLNFLVVALVLFSATDHANFTLFNKNMFSLTDSITNTMLLLSVFIICIFIGWISFDTIYLSLKSHFDKSMTPTAFSYMKNILRFVGPLILIILLLKTLFFM